MVYKTVAFDGLSLAGKSTMVQMLLERSLDAEVVRENTFDPYRPTTSKVNRLLKEVEPYEAVKLASEEFQILEKFYKMQWKTHCNFKALHDCKHC